MTKKFWSWKGDLLEVKNARRPKMANRGGRTWDYFGGSVDGQPVEFCVDTTWGWYIYFEHGGHWYKVSWNPLDNGGYDFMGTMGRRQAELYTKEVE